jgi:sporulation integral membrane protein YlbJ
MKQKLISVIIIILLLNFTFFTLVYSKDIIKTINFSFLIWTKNLIPSLFPFFIIADLLTNYGVVELISEFSKKFMNKLFNLSGNASFILFMSMISGFPSASKYTKELFEKGLISKMEAEQILTFTHFSNPLFIIGTIGLIYLKNYRVGVLILLVHYGTNFIIALLFRNYNKLKIKENSSKFSKILNNIHQKRINNHKTFAVILSTSIINSFNTLILIFGTITFFLMITTIIDNIVQIDSYNRAIFNGIFEMTQGLKYTSELDIPLVYKATLSTFFISFGGLSVHLQTLSILSSTKIKYHPFLIARIIHGSIASLIIYLIL